MLFEYDNTSPESILEYAKNLEGQTFLEVFDTYLKETDEYVDETKIENTKAKGQLGVFLEEYYFGYKPNGEQAADFKEAGVELKLTCVDLKKNGSYTAGERLSITNISFEGPVEMNFFKSHLWGKINLILLIQYFRDKLITERMQYTIMYVNLFTPPNDDLKIIIDDYKKINQKIMDGRAHELSEGDTMYLGACTKGATALKSLRPQYYGDHTPAKKRNFCFKRQYMDYILHTYILRDTVPCEKIVPDVATLGNQTFEDYIINQISINIGKSDRELCTLYNREYNNNKAQWSDLAYRMLGIKGNHAEEFLKANIVVKSIRLEEKGNIKENMSFPPFKFLDLVQQEWDESDIYEYFSETKFLFVIYKKKGNEYILHKAKFWNMPTKDLESTVRMGWESIKHIIKDVGVQFTVNPNGTISNNLPGKRDNPIIHIRPHAGKSAYQLNNGIIRGNLAKDANPLPDGQWMTTQGFWINNNYILKQLDD